MKDKNDVIKSTYVKAKKNLIKSMVSPPKYHYDN